MMFAAGIFTAITLWLAQQPRARVVRPQQRPRTLAGLLPAAMLGAGLVAGVVMWLSGTRLVVALLAVVVLAELEWQRRRRFAKRQARQRSTHLRQVCDGIAADLAAGQPPRAALLAAQQVWPEFEPVTRAEQLDADVPAAWRRLAQQPGAEQARVVAAAWQVAAQSGAGLGPAMQLAARNIRREEQAQRIIATELAGAQAAAKLLAGLPVLVLLLSSGMGGNPIRFLLDTPVGVVCLSLGVGLLIAGVRWLQAIETQV